MCYNPKTIFVTTSNPDVGEGTDYFLTEDGEIRYKRKIQVPCGVCLDCLEKEATMWAHRIADEASCHKQNCMLTLTYAEDRHSLDRRDLQLFLKKLRKRLSPITIRVFYCGEYGSKGKRPHYHVIVFGWRPDDLILWKKSKKGFDVWLSDIVFKIWQKGFISVSDLTLRSSKYSAKYLQKYQPVPKGVVKPFTGMSNRPGIGFYKINERCLNTDKIWHEGSFVKVPRYYLDKLAVDHPCEVERLKDFRLEKGELFKMTPEDLQELEKKCKSILDTKLNPL